MFATPTSFLPVNLRRIGWVALGCSALVLSACGGGSRAKEYAPTSVVSFGDEGSAFAPSESVPEGAGGAAGAITGLTYTVNSLLNLSTTFCTDQTPGTLCVTPVSGVTEVTLAGTPTYRYFNSINTGDTFNVVTRIDLGTGNYAAVTEAPLKRTVDQFYNCTASTIWTQVVARSFGKGYEAECKLDRAGAVSYAAEGAKVADLSAQVAAAKAAGQLKAGVLVTVWLGQNDLIEIYGNPALATVADKEAAAKARAGTLIDGVNAIVSTGAQVLLVNAANLAYSPYALAAKTTGCTVGAPACNGDMEAVVRAFNKQLSGYAFGGRRVGNVDAEQLTNTYARSGEYKNERVCDAAKMVRPDGTLDNSSVKYCNSETLVGGGNLGAYLWTDDQHIASVLHSGIAAIALTRATDQF